VTDPAPAEVATIGGRKIRITNPDRVLWPATGTTKRELIAYQQAIAAVLLPYLRRRATMLWRFPEGVDGPGWFQANCRGRPDWLPVHEIVGRKGETLSYCLVEDPAALVWLANLGTIELHPHLWTVDAPAEPTWLVLDLDPGPPAGLVETARVALHLRERLGDAGLASGVKTSGGLGLHVLVPLVAGETFERTKALARALAHEAARALPDLVVERSVRAERSGRIYIDWIQNTAGRQLVAPYSLRATPIPVVSTPVTWDEVARTAAGGDPTALRFTPRNVLDRVERVGDLLEDVPPASLRDLGDWPLRSGGSGS
jgi:bifunctional non-homologous end joining protein LigD